MSVEDFWLRMYALAADLDPISDANWKETLVELIAEYNDFPSPTREALRGQISVLITRLTHLHSQMSQ